MLSRPGIRDTLNDDGSASFFEFLHELFKCVVINMYALDGVLECGVFSSENSVTHLMLLLIVIVLYPVI